MNIDIQDSIPIYYQLAEKIKRDIISGVIKVKERLPAEDLLAEKMKVSRVTVRSSLKKLEAEGFLFRVKNRGTFASLPQRRERQIILLSDLIPENSLTLHSIIAGAISHAQQQNIHLQVRKKSELAAIIPGLRNNERFQSGIIFMLNSDHDPRDFDALDRINVPWLIQGGEHTQNCNYCDIDNESAMFKVVDHLADLGHKRFAIFSVYDLQNRHYLQRYEAAVKRIMERTGFFDQNLYMSATVKNFKEDTWACCEKVFKKKSCPTALVCLSDLIAATSVQWLTRNGISVPGKVSVTGFDNADYTWVITPKLTTVTLSYFKWGATAVEQMIKLMRDFSNRKVRCKMDLEFMLRESTGVPFN